MTLPQEPRESADSDSRRRPRAGTVSARGLVTRELLVGLMEAGRPLALVTAQLLYMAQPFVGERAARLGRLLESRGDSSEKLRPQALGEGGKLNMRGDD
jgi:hypothetical protein